MPNETRDVEDHKLKDMRFLSVTQVMELFKISRSALHAMTRRPIDPVPSVKMGKFRRYPLNKLKVWMEKLGR